MACNDPTPLNDPPLCDCNGGGPSLQFFRTPDAGHVGDTITYTVILSNPSTNTSCPITNITASIALPYGTTVTLPAPTTLASGASSGPLTATYTIAAGDVSGNTLSATARASGILQDCFCNSPTSAQSQVCSFVAQPNFTLTKTVSPAVSKAGDSVQYTFTICNTGNIALNRVSSRPPWPRASAPRSRSPSSCRQARRTGQSNTGGGMGLLPYWCMGVDVCAKWPGRPPRPHVSLSASRNTACTSGRSRRGKDRSARVRLA